MTLGDGGADAVNMDPRYQREARAGVHTLDRADLACRGRKLSAHLAVSVGLGLIPELVAIHKRPLP